jgi:predicted HicB family RNase H-like nuclease
MSQKDNEPLRHLHIRITPTLYRKLTFKAWKNNNKKINTIVVELLEDYVKDCSEEEMKEVFVT